MPKKVKFTYTINAIVKSYTVKLWVDHNDVMCVPPFVMMKMLKIQHKPTKAAVKSALRNMLNDYNNKHTWLYE